MAGQNSSLNETKKILESQVKMRPGGRDCVVDGCIECMRIK